jgi:hypothetical protein
MVKKKEQGGTVELAPLYRKHTVSFEAVGTFIASVALSASIGFLGGGTMDTVAGAFVDKPTEEDLANDAAYLDESRAELDRIPSLESRIPETLPADCKIVLDVYINGSLAQTGENQAVEDILREKDAPCGESPREVREQYTGYSSAVRTHNSDIENAQSQIIEAEYSLEEAQKAFEDYKSDDEFTGSHAGGIAGLGVGLLAGLFIVGGEHMLRRDDRKKVLSLVEEIQSNEEAEENAVTIEMINKLKPIHRERMVREINAGRDIGIAFQRAEWDHV